MALRSLYQAVQYASLVNLINNFLEIENNIID